MYIVQHLLVEPAGSLDDRTQKPAHAYNCERALVFAIAAYIEELFELVHGVQVEDRSARQVRTLAEIQNRSDQLPSLRADALRHLQNRVQVVPSPFGLKFQQNTFCSLPSQNRSIAISQPSTL